MATVTQYPHLRFDSTGVAYIGDTRYKVLHLAGEHYQYGWSAEEMLRQHPDLRPEEVYAAFTYFYDHYDELIAAMTASADAKDHADRSTFLTRDELLRRKATRGD
jgi:uncharacterized protein (DUF433 family)